MSALKRKIILYDDVCPLCKAYTSGFVSLGWLMPDHRIAFSQASPEILSRIDLDRARHEIPLHDLDTGETLYGKEALFFILGEQMPWFKPLFRFAPFRAFVFVLYQIITYNRRIIAGSQPPETGFDCGPDFHLFYRWLYIAIAGGLALLLGYYANITADASLIPAVLVFFVATFTGSLMVHTERQTTYFGHLATVLLLIALFTSILGWSPVTALVMPLLGGYWFSNRVCVLFQ